MNRIVRRIVESADLRRELIELCAADGAPLTQQAISEWKKTKRGVPATRVLIVSKLLKLPPHVIRPDIFPLPAKRRKSGNHNHAQQQRLL